MPYAEGGVVPCRRCLIGWELLTSQKRSLYIPDTDHVTRRILRKKWAYDSVPWPTRHFPQNSCWLPATANHHKKHHIYTPVHQITGCFHIRLKVPARRPSWYQVNAHLSHRLHAENLPTMHFPSKSKTSNCDMCPHTDDHCINNTVSFAVGVTVFVVFQPWKFSGLMK